MEKLHSLTVRRIQNELLEWKKNPQGRRPSALSHMMRVKKYSSPLLSTRALANMSVDREAKIAVVEPYVTQYQLARETLKYNLLPPVIAEFKNITVGGAIMGSSLESSSHRYGQFNDSASSYEILLGTGEVVSVSPEKDPDLFYGVSGSFGSLGVLLSAQIPLIEAKPWVELEISKFSRLSDAFNFMNGKWDKVDYLEGIVFARDHIKVISGQKARESAAPLCSQNSWSDDWYAHVIFSNEGYLKMSTSDYVFRYDRGAFWMGNYALWPSLLYRFLLGISKSNKPRGYYNRLKFPGRLFRSLWGWQTDSGTLYKHLHAKKENWFENNFVVQDFYIPENKALEFTNFAIGKSEIFPLWLCPCKGTETGQFLSPHFGHKRFYDVGVYGFPIDKALETTGMLERETHRLGGRKMFYSWNVLNEEEVWRHYSRNEYESLRHKWGADEVFPSFIEKIL